MVASSNQLYNGNPDYLSKYDGVYPMLGLLRKEIFYSITKKEDKVPNSDERVNWIHEAYQNNACLGDIYRGILTAKEDFLLKER